MRISLYLVELNPFPFCLQSRAHQNRYACGSIVDIKNLLPSTILSVLRLALHNKGNDAVIRNPTYWFLVLLYEILFLSFSSPITQTKTFQQYVQTFSWFDWSLPVNRNSIVFPIRKGGTNHHTPVGCSSAY